MSGLEYRSMSDGRCRSMEDECLQSTVVSEYRSMELVYGSTAVERNRATNRCCCRSMRSALLCGLGFLVASSNAGHVPENLRRKKFVSET
ncbi:hypothetical protein F2Q68_00038868 [Brassica cretica]|uniref:Uncharacterized protein n=1 Tax=Brassica cretica TaxID=69181 RepID=A0A8S9MM43_BRACR|nr:hypothetical protein F2Q68_00038868 [Brassica cretica]